MKSIFPAIVSLFIYLSALSQEKIMIINSEHLSKKIKVVTYNTGVKTKKKPIVYITDGEKFINNGGLQKVQFLTEKEKIPAAHYVFVSTVDPKTKEDYRNYYFFNNPKYLDFFEYELIPRIETPLLTYIKPEDRSLIGISFGGLNAAYFSAKSKKFKKFALLSPVTYPRNEELMKAISFSENKDLGIFLSTGTNDSENYFKELKAMYTSKNYHIKTIKTNGGHDFKNWNGQLTLVLTFLLSGF